MNRKIISAEYNIDTGMLRVKFSVGITAEYYIGCFEDTLDTTIATRAELDWLLDNDPLTYAQLMITGRMQEYLDICAREYSEVQSDIVASVRMTGNDATTDYITREFMMYDS